jgi:PKD repeat protein
MKNSFLICLLLLQLNVVVFGHILNFGVEVSAQPETSISIDPPTNTAEPDQYFAININVTDVTDLYSWGARVNWPTGLLSTNAVNITEGLFLQAGGTTSFSKTVFANYVNIGSTLLAAATGVNGSGTLATAIFKVLDGGNCTLSLSNISLLNSTFGAIDHVSVNGYFYTNKPVARFAFTPQEYYGYYGHPLVDETVTFNASTSYDPDEPYDSSPGDVVDYQWDFGDGNSGSGEVATHAYSEPGSLTVTLTVTDDEGETDIATRPYEGSGTVLVQHHDIAILNVTAIPSTFSSGATVTVNITVANKGSVTEVLNVTVYRNFSPVKTFRTDPSPSPPYFSNMFLHKVGPTWLTTLLTGQNGTTTLLWDTTGVYPGNYSLGVYAFLIKPSTRESVPDLEEEELLVDNWMSYGTVTATGEVKHDLAIEEIKVDPTALKIGGSSSIQVTLKNEGNVDEQFNATVIIRYGLDIFKQESWTNQTIRAGETLKLEKPAFNIWLTGANTTDEGTYNITASVVLLNATTLDFLEPYNASVPDDDPIDNRRIELVDIRMIPVAHFARIPSLPFVDTAVTFNASASYAPGIPGGIIKEYSWDFGDGTKITQTTPVAIHTYRAVGTFTVTLKVKDNALLTNNATRSFTVHASSGVAITNIVFSPNAATSGKLVNINITVSAYINVTTGAPLSQNFNLTTYFDNNKINTQSDITLAAGSSTTLTFTWDTTGVSGGNYTVKAVATTLTGETTFAGGTVSINKLPSTMTIKATPTTLTPGATATINGTISVAQTGISVTILYRLSEDETWSTLETVTTSSGGFYTYSWIPENTGVYAVKSRWEGDDARMPSESEVLAVSVQEAPSSSIFLYTTIALAVIIIAMAIYIIRGIRAEK